MQAFRRYFYKPSHNHALETDQFQVNNTTGATNKERHPKTNTINCARRASWINCRKVASFFKTRVRKDNRRDFTGVRLYYS
jgi:hypothetical protein